MATIHAQIPEDLMKEAEALIAEGWAGDLDQLLSDALRRYLESHSSTLSESFIRKDIEWGLRGSD